MRSKIVAAAPAAVRSSSSFLASASSSSCLYASARQRLALLRRSNDHALGAQSFAALSTRSSGLSTRLHISEAARTPWTRAGSRRGLKTVQAAEAKQRLGPFSIISAFVFVGAGAGLYFYFRFEKERMERQRIAEATKGVGKPKVGGPFELTDHNGQAWKSSENMDGKFSLVYFGFSHCPDICPEELDKMADMIDVVAKTLPLSQGNPEMLPIFITCDPARDSPQVLKTYLKEFHPAIVGLTGPWEQIKAVCRLYRVYFSTPSHVKPGQDYLVDHSIYFYLMDPEGDFVEAIGRQHTSEQGAKLIIDHMGDWRGKFKPSRTE